MAVEVRTYAGVPPVAAFASASGTPIVINTATSTAYYLAAGDVVTALGGGGGFTNPMTTAGDIIVGGVAGAPTRLAKGADGTILTMVAGAEAWVAASGGGTKSITPQGLTPMTSLPPLTSFATLSTRNAIPTLNFLNGVDESIFWVGRVPQGATFPSGIKVTGTATSPGIAGLNFTLEFSFWKLTTILDTDNYDTATSVTTVTAAPGVPVVFTQTCTTIASLAAGDAYAFKIKHKGTTDTMANFLEISSVDLQSA